MKSENGLARKQFDSQHIFPYTYNERIFDLLNYC